MPIAPLLKAENLAIRFDGITVLERACIEVAEGQCVGLVGENGCGKTSLLNVLSGADHVTLGTIFFLTDRGTLTDVTRWPAWRRARMGLLQFFQSPHIWRNLTVREHVLAAATDHSLDGSLIGTACWSLSSSLRRRTRARCDDLLDFVGLADRSNDRACDLSFGQRKLVGLARLLAAPVRRMLLLDEPTAGIAPELIVRMIDLLRKVRASGVGMLVVEHDREMLNDLADTVIELRQGQILSFEEVASNEQTGSA